MRPGRGKRETTGEDGHLPSLPGLSRHTRLADSSSFPWQLIAEPGGVAKDGEAMPDPLVAGNSSKGLFPLAVPLTQTILHDPYHTEHTRKSGLSTGLDRIECRESFPGWGVFPRFERVLGLPNSSHDLCATRTWPLVVGGLESSGLRSDGHDLANLERRSLFHLQSRVAIEEVGSHLRAGQQVWLAVPIQISKAVIGTVGG